MFFQQSYVIDKRITPRFISYEKTDLWIGIVIPADDYRGTNGAEARVHNGEIGVVTKAGKWSANVKFADGREVVGR